MECFYVITNQLKDPDLETTKQIQTYLRQNGKECLIHESDTFTDVWKIPERAGCVLVLGGDGTLLQVARDTVDRGIPLLGVNLGRIGYLAEVEKGNIRQALDKLIAGEYEIEERMMLSGSVLHDGKKIEEAYALNDIVITRGGTLRIIDFLIYVNGQPLNAYHADGVVLATPTGSTGYSMSAGGPIVEPRAKLMLVTPICPHTLNTRSIILSAEDSVTVEIGKGRHGDAQEAEVHFDGSRRLFLRTGDSVVITQSEKKTRIIKINKVSFLETLHKKMKE